MRLARYFGTSPKFWMGLQADYDLDMAEDKSREEIERLILLRNVA